MLATYVNDRHDDWDDKLSAVVFAYNNTTQSSTGFAPNQVIFGRLLPTTSDRKLQIEPKTQPESRELIEKTLAEKLRKSQEAQKRAYDEKVRSKNTYSSGDLVVVANTRQVVGHVRSFEPKFTGPFEVVRRIGDANYELLNRASGKTNTIHYNRMLPYKMRSQDLNLKMNSNNAYCRENKEDRVVTSLDEVLERPGRSIATVIRAIEANMAAEIGHENEEDWVWVERGDPHDAIDNDANEIGDENDEVGENRSSGEDEEHVEVDEADLIHCTVEGCQFKTTKASGLAIHKGRVHK